MSNSTQLDRQTLEMAMTSVAGHTLLLFIPLQRKTCSLTCALLTGTRAPSESPAAVSSSHTLVAGEPPSFLRLLGNRHFYYVPQSGYLLPRRGRSTDNTIPSLTHQLSPHTKLQLHDLSLHPTPLCPSSARLPSTNDVCRIRPDPIHTRPA
jgi:hypothetical protein